MASQTQANSAQDARSRRTSLSSDSSSEVEYDFSIELDKVLSVSHWIEYMEWSQNMDVIALIMHQSTNNSQHLWLQRCVGKWQNLLNVDLSQHFDDASTTVTSLAWRFDGNGVCLGLSNGEIVEILIENGGSDSPPKTMEQGDTKHASAIAQIAWVTDKADVESSNDHALDGAGKSDLNHAYEFDDDEHNDDRKRFDQENIDTSNFDNFETLFASSESNLNDINQVMQNNEALLSCTQLNPADYAFAEQHMADEDNAAVHAQSTSQQQRQQQQHAQQHSDPHLLRSLVHMQDETNKFLSKIPALPKPPRPDFRYKIDAHQHTLQSLMRRPSVPPIPRKTQPSALSILVSNDAQSISLHASGMFSIGNVQLQHMRPSNTVLTAIDEENEHKTNLTASTWSLQCFHLTHDLQCMPVLMASDHGQELFLRFVHCPILHSRRNELLIVCKHSEYVHDLLEQLNKLQRHLVSRWAMAQSSLKGKITALEDEIDTHRLSSTWQHELKHSLLAGSPSIAFEKFAEKSLNMTALERGYKSFDQFVNEMLDILQKNLSHVIQELIFRCTELQGYSMWMERFECLGIQEKKLTAFVDKLSALYIKLDQLQSVLADAKLNLVAFKDYLVFLCAVHNDEESDKTPNFDKLDSRRILNAIDYDLKPSRVSLFLNAAVMSKKDVELFKVPNEANLPLFLKPILAKLRKKWKRFERFSFTYLLQDIRRSWPPILNALSSSVSRCFTVDDTDYGLLYLCNGSRNSNNNSTQYVYPSLDTRKDVAFVTTTAFANTLEIETDVHLMCINAHRISTRSNERSSRLVFLAIVPQIENTQSKQLMSEDIWTEQFEQFEHLISEFPAQGSIADIRVCAVDVESLSDDGDDDDRFTQLDFDALEIVQIEFVNDERLAILAKLRYSTRMKQITCLLTVNLKKLDFEFQSNIKLNAYDEAINEMVWDYGIIANKLDIGECEMLMFSDDVDGQELRVSGSRKLAAIACDPCMADNKCNRLIVLDINVNEDEDDDDEEEDSDEEEDMEKQSHRRRDKEEQDESDSHNIIDID